ncbi:MAG: hypothetical protein JOY98_15470 [Candidatus Eremiobacteraeota bacterium]|nr:hypothetical protein [Candidatus Eremiobacteraeota bacterium]
MNRWIARVLALVLAGGAIYLVVANVHAGSTVLECTLAAAVLAIATIVFLWRRPTAALVLNAVWVIGAFAASAALTASHVLPNFVASQQAMTTVAGSPPGPSANAPIAGDAWQPAPSDPSIRGANETVVPTSVLGSDQVDDGIVEEGYAAKTVAAGSLVGAQFGTTAPATPDPKIANARKLEDAIPTSEYNLDRLADTLPNDPVAVYRFVRDNVGTDVYAGSMRGAIGTWLGRAGNSADKARLLSWLLAKKGIAARFDRGTLSDGERAQVAAAAASAPRLIVPQTDADAAAYTNARAVAGAAFASWATPKLQAANAPVGAGGIDASRVPAQHYWIRVYANGKQMDLDPALPSMHEGQHLGTADAAFKESPTFPNDDTMHARIRLIATSGGAQTILAEGIGAIPDLAYSPLIAGVTPQDGNPQVLETAIVLGSSVKTGKTIAASQLPDSLVLQVDRATGAGATSTIRRTIFDRSAAGTGAQTISGIHTIVLAPGSAPMFFLYETARDARILTENAAAQAAGGKKPNQGLYPSLLAAFYSRDDALAAALGDRNSLRLFRDRPDVVMVHTTVAGTNGSQATYRTVFDIADNGMNAVSPQPALAAANLARGWGDTWIERDLLGANGAGAMTAWLANKKSATYAVAKNVPDSLDGANVALQASGGQPQWWDIDPSSASVVGRLPGGWGPEMEEEGTMLTRLQQAYDVYEIHEADKECEHPGPACDEEICKLTVSGIPIAASVAGAEVKATAAVVGVFLAVKAVGQGCGGLNPGGGEGGEGGGGDPSPDDGHGPG